MTQQGIWDWSTYKQAQNVWIAGREVGTSDNLKAGIRWAYPMAAGGVPTASGFFHQATRASPQAPTGATLRAAFALTFTPQLDEDSARHIQAVMHASTMGVVQIWLPWALPESWKITAARTQYTLSRTISGSAATWPGTGHYHEPIVEVREISGELDTALTFAASSPSSSEFTLVNTTANQDYITTGDLTAKDGKMLIAWAWCLSEVRVLPSDEGFDARGEWGQTLSLEFAPSVRAYEDD